MRVFISWSGDRSRLIADALKRWLCDVFEQVEPWMSEHDLDAGSRWAGQLAGTLEECQFGIVCLTKDNQAAPWLVFEAGCLAKTASVARVVPYLVELAPSEVKYPLAQFQSVAATRPGTMKLVKSLNEFGGFRIPEDRLSRLFDKWWPDLESALSRISTSSSTATPVRSDRELLEELVGLMRGSIRAQGPPSIRQEKPPSIRVASPPSARAENPPFEFVHIDSTPLLRDEGGFKDVIYHRSETVSDFLDSVWRALNAKTTVPPFTYGSEWLLRDAASGRFYNDIGREYCETRGEVRDERRLESVGIKANDRLEVVAAPRTPNGEKAL